jgi:hypothetical protein
VVLQLQAVTYLPAVVGIAIGGAISALVTWRAMWKPDAVGSDGEPVTDADRRLALQLIAAIYFIFTLGCLIAAVVVGQTGFLVAAAINFAIGCVALGITGLPRGYWHHWAAIWRR